MGLVALTSYHTAKSWNVYSFLFSASAERACAGAAGWHEKHQRPRHYFTGNSAECSKSKISFDLDATGDLHGISPAGICSEAALQSCISYFLCWPRPCKNKRLIRFAMPEQPFNCCLKTWNQIESAVGHH